ncbi:MAG: trigger factor [Dehalococcoidia bacterium]
MKVTVERLPSREVVLNIEAEPDDVERYKQRAYRSLVQRARIPGFRKGKAPLAMLERYLGKGVVLEEAINRMIPDVTQKAIEEESIEAASVPSIEVSSTEPVAWTAKVALAPQVDLGDYTALRIEPQPVDVPAEHVDKVLEELRFEQAPWETVNRSALMGDLMTLDVHIERDGEVLKDDKGVQYRPEPGLPWPVPGFAEEVVGLGAGEAKEFDLPMPVVEGEEGQEAMTRFRVTVTDVKGKTLPPLDDEFAKGVAEGYDDVQALRGHVTADLKAAAEQTARAELREQALERLIQGATVEFASSMVEHEAQHMLEAEEQRLASGRVSVDKYLESVGKTREQLMEEMERDAERRVIRSLVLTELMEREGIEVSPDEVEEAVRELVGASGERRAEAQRTFGSEQGQRSLRSSLLTRKTLDRLVEIVSQSPGETAGASGTATEEETAPDDDES